MKKIISTFLAMLVFASFVGCNKNAKDDDKKERNKIDFNRIINIIEDDYIDWYIDYYSDTDISEKEAKESFQKDIEIGEDGSYISYICYSLHDNSESDTYNDIADLIFLFDLEKGYEIVRLINKELGFPDSIIKKMENTSAFDGKQVFEGEDVILTWSYVSNSHFEYIYEIK